MTVILAIALLLLTVAVVVLYAMMGELWNRVQTESPSSPTWLHELEDAKAGASADTWPPTLASFATKAKALLLVLSPVCTTCTKVAGELAKLPYGALGDSVGLVVSAADAAAGESFVEAHRLARFPHFVDAGGIWITTNFGVNKSPTALSLKSGSLATAHSFGAVDAIMPLVNAHDREGAH